MKRKEKISGREEDGMSVDAVCVMSHMLVVASRRRDNVSSGCRSLRKEEESKKSMKRGGIKVLNQSSSALQRDNKCSKEVVENLHYEQKERQSRQCIPTPCINQGKATLVPHWYRMLYVHSTKTSTKREKEEKSKQLCTNRAQSQTSNLIRS